MSNRQDATITAIPESIRCRAQWMLWKYNAEGNKEPWQVHQPWWKARSNDSTTWATYEDAVAKQGGYSGIAIAISPDDPLCGIDLDGCIDDEGNLRSWVQPILEKFDGVAYAEISPSGKGMKLLTWANKPAGSRCKKIIADGKQQIECYDHDRFWTVTGNVYGAGDFATIEDGQEAVDWLCETYLKNDSAHAEPVARTQQSDLRKRAQDYINGARNVGEGDRNDATFSLAGHLAAIVDEHGQRLAEPEILSLVQFWNTANNPPIDEKEVAATVRSAMVNGTPREPKPPRESVSANTGPADFFVAEHAKQSGESSPLPPRPEQPKPKSNLPEPITADQFVVKFPGLREPVVDQMIRTGDVVNFVAATKVGKIWLILNLVFCILLGLKFLNTFRTKRGKVLLIDNELQPETLSHRLQMVASRFNAEDVLKDLVIVSCRGKLVDVLQLGKIIEQFQPGAFVLCIVDAFYRLIPEGKAENANADLTSIYNLLDKYAAHLDAAVAVVHHSTKGSQSEKRSSDVGAGGGAQSRAADSHVVLREHEESGVVVMTADLRSFKPLEPACYRFDWPMWKEAPECDPTLFKREYRGGRPRGEKVEKVKKPSWDVARLTNEIVTVEPLTKRQLTAKADDHEDRLSAYRLERLLELAETKGKVFRWKFGRHDSHKFATIPQPSLEGGVVSEKLSPEHNPLGVSVSEGGTGETHSPPLPEIDLHGELASWSQGSEVTT